MDEILALVWQPFKTSFHNRSEDWNLRLPYYVYCHLRSLLHEHI